jgi:hypothetical protein
MAPTSAEAPVLSRPQAPRRLEELVIRIVGRRPDDALKKQERVVGRRSRPFVRAWRVTSRTRLWPGPVTPALIGDDLVVALDVTRQTKADYLIEHLVVRLGATGGTRQIVSLDPNAVWGDVPITGLRVGPDAELYQLRSDPARGVSIARYSLRPTTLAPPAAPTRPAEVAEPGLSPSVTEPSATAPSVAKPAPAAPVVRPAKPAATARASDPAGPWLVPGSAALGAGALVAVGGWLLFRRRHPVDLAT